jgi:hypothetical protein
MCIETTTNSLTYRHFLLFILLILGAVFDCYQEGIAVHPEIMFPLVCSDHEIEIIAPVVKVISPPFLSPKCVLYSQCL